MKAGEKLKTKAGYEVLLFPLEYLNMSQDEGGDFSHAGTLAMDFLGWGENGRVYHCPYYAPCSCRCIGTTEIANRIWVSTNIVYRADNTLGYVCWVQAHDESPHPVGTVLEQGDLLGYTGTAGEVTGDHVHFNFANGTYQGWEQVPPNNNWQLKNSVHIYNYCFVNDTVIINGYNHDWKTYDEPPKLEKKKRKFPWVLYANKIRKNY